MWQNSHSLGKPFVNVLLLGVQGAGPGPDSHGYPVSTKNNCFHHPQQLLFQQHCQKVIPWDSPWSGPRPCSPRWLDLNQMVMDIQKQLKTTTFIIPNNFCFNNIAKKSFPVTPLGQVLDLAVQGVWTQMVMDIRKQLKTTTFIIPNNFCFNNIAKKSFPGTPLGQVPDLAVGGRWTSP